MQLFNLATISLLSATVAKVRATRVLIAATVSQPIATVAEVRATGVWLAVIVSRPPFLKLTLALLDMSSSEDYSFLDIYPKPDHLRDRLSTEIIANDCVLPEKLKRQTHLTSLDLLIRNRIIATSRLDYESVSGTCDVLENHRWLSTLTEMSIAAYDKGPTDKRRVPARLLLSGIHRTLECYCVNFVQMVFDQKTASIFLERHNAPIWNCKRQRRIGAAKFIRLLFRGPSDG